VQWRTACKAETVDIQFSHSHRL